jgi:hypothetical protein
VEQAKSSRSREDQSSAGPLDPGGHMIEICVFQHKVFSEGNKGGGHKPSEVQSHEESWPTIIVMVILEKKYSPRASTRKLVLPEVPESRVAGNLNL